MMLNCHRSFILVGFYEPIVKKHEDNVRFYFLFKDISLKVSN